MGGVVVTGGTGVLGSYLVPLLLARGHETVVLSRRANPETAHGALAVRGDVRTGEGLRARFSDREDPLGGLA
jgi:nucleoside-diphosphate-sugar epimerase